MLTGEVAYPKDGDIAKLWAHISNPPPQPSTTRTDLVPAFDDGRRQGDGQGSRGSLCDRGRDGRGRP